MYIYQIEPEIMIWTSFKAPKKFEIVLMWLHCAMGSPSDLCGVDGSLCGPYSEKPAKQNTKILYSFYWVLSFQNFLPGNIQNQQDSNQEI